VKNDDDLRASQIISAASIPALGNTRSASTGGATVTPAASSTVVVGNQVRREWLVGDPWDSAYYFKDFDNDSN
jgi:hypothetical protein